MSDTVTATVNATTEAITASVNTNYDETYMRRAVSGYGIVDCNNGNVTATDEQSMLSRWIISNPKNDNTSTITIPSTAEGYIPTLKSVLVFGAYDVTVQLQSGGSTALVKHAISTILEITPGLGVTLKSDGLSTLARRGSNGNSAVSDADSSISYDDPGKILYFTSASAQTFNILTEAVSGIEAGAKFTVKCTGAGGVTFVPAGGVTIIGRTTLSQNQEVTLSYEGGDVWVI